MLAFLSDQTIPLDSAVIQVHMNEGQGGNTDQRQEIFIPGFFVLCISS